jgi:alpha-1,2-mannosyltransferase
MRSMLRDVAPYMAACFGGLLALYLGVGGSHIDREVFADAARLALEGSSPYGPYIYPPAGLALALLALLGPMVWDVLSLAAWGYSAWLLVGAAWPERDARRRAEAAAWVFAVGTVLQPTLLTLAIGQVGLLLLALVLHGTLGRGRPRGLALGFAVAVKLTAAIVVLPLALARRWRDVRWAVAGGVASTALLSLAFPQSVTAYVGGAWRYAFEIGAQQTAQNHSLAGLVRNALLPTWAGTLLVLAVFAAGVAAATLAWRRGDALAGVAISLLAGLLVSPLSWTHHWVAAFPVLVLLVRELRGWAARTLLAVGMAGMLLWIDVLGRVGQQQPTSATELVVMQWLPLWGLVVVVWCVRGVLLAPPSGDPAYADAGADPMPVAGTASD